MHFPTTIMAVIALGAINASALPKASKTFSLASDAADGAYIHTIGPNGDPQTTYVGELANTSDVSKRHQRRDYQGQIFCKNQYILNSGDVSAAEQGLEALFPYGRSFYISSVSYKIGTAVAYGCNYGDGQTVTGDFLAAQFGNIAGQCGGSSGGYVSYPDWKASYGIDSAAAGYC